MNWQRELDDTKKLEIRHVILECKILGLQWIWDTLSVIRNSSSAPKVLSDGLKNVFETSGHLFSQPKRDLF